MSDVNIGGVWMIAEVGERKKVCKRAKPVSHPPGLMPSMMKNQYQLLTEEEEELRRVRESQEVTHKFAPGRKSLQKFAKKERLQKLASELKLELTVVQPGLSVPRDGQVSSGWILLGQEKR